MSTALDYLIESGESIDSIQRRIEQGISVEEQVEAVRRLREAKPERQSVVSLGGMRVDLEAVKVALSELGVSVKYNLLLKQTEIAGLPECYSAENAVNVLPVYLADYLKGCGYKGVTQQAVEAYLFCIADQHRYNPVMEYLLSGIWDGTNRFPEIYRILGVTEPKYQTYIRKWLVQCVALGLNDEDEPIGADGVLVLQGEQGWLRLLFPHYNAVPAVVCRGRYYRHGLQRFFNNGVERLDNRARRAGQHNKEGAIIAQSVHNAPGGQNPRTVCP